VVSPSIVDPGERVLRPRLLHVVDAVACPRLVDFPDEQVL
jgi:hypothetical protein